MARLALLLALLTGAFLAPFTGALEQHPSAHAKQKVVYHINEEGLRQQLVALQTIQNHLDAEGVENVDVKVVLHGGGLAMLLKPSALRHVWKIGRANGNPRMLQRVQQLRQQGVEFLICGSTAKARGINPIVDLSGIQPKDVVASGLNELVRLQQQGHVYIRP